MIKQTLQLDVLTQVLKLIFNVIVNIYSNHRQLVLKKPTMLDQFSVVVDTTGQWFKCNDIPQPTNYSHSHTIHLGWGHIT